MLAAIWALTAASVACPIIHAFVTNRQYGNLDSCEHFLLLFLANENNRVAFIG